jgi:dihydroorotate dehydrogenase (NAD+) catalytic subunit
MLNSIGLANPGGERFLAETLPRLAELAVPVWISVGGFTAGDYADLCESLDGRPEVDAIELNVSCPNVDEAPQGVGEVVAAARAATEKTLYTKLSPATPDVAEAARAAQAAGTDGLTLVNTIRGLALDERTLRPKLSRGAGGFSGPALKPIALAAVHACYEATRLPIVGVGGIGSGRDVLEFVAAGAADVALGTVLFTDPGAPARIRAEVEQELDARDVDGADNIFAAAHAHEPEREAPQPVNTSLSV